MIGVDVSQFNFRSCGLKLVNDGGFEFKRNYEGIIVMFAFNEKGNVFLE